MQCQKCSDLLTRDIVTDCSGKYVDRTLVVAAKQVARRCKKIKLLKLLQRGFIHHSRFLVQQSGSHVLFCQFRPNFNMEMDTAASGAGPGLIAIRTLDNGARSSARGAAGKLVRPSHARVLEANSLSDRLQSARFQLPGQIPTSTSLRPWT
jgi:hypothetical protein